MYSQLDARTSVLYPAVPLLQRVRRPRQVHRSYSMLYFAMFAAWMFCAVQGFDQMPEFSALPSALMEV